MNNKRLYVDWCELYPWPFLETADTHFERVAEYRATCRNPDSQEAAEEAARAMHKPEQLVMSAYTEERLLKKFEEVYGILKQLKALKDGESCHLDGIGEVKREVKS